MKSCFTSCVLFIINVLAFAAPFHGQVKRFLQPDGSQVDVKLFGTEYYMRAEGLDGYTLIREPKSKWICYARLSENGTTLVSTGLRYTDKVEGPQSLQVRPEGPPHLDVPAVERERIIQEKKKVLDGVEQKIGGTNSVLGTPVHDLSGNVRALCIVVDFSDEPGTVPIASFEGFCNDTNYTGFGNNGSVRSYFRAISGGLLDYENVVFGYFRAPLTFAQYDAMPYAEGAQQILGYALNQIKLTGFDFSTLSLNPDNSIMAINLMYTGEPPTWAEGMWHHAGTYTSFSANGVHTNRYNCSPANSPLELGVVVHENGHMIGKWPDTYKYTSTTGPDGIGSFDVMCSYGDPKNPPPPNPLFRANVGWGKVTDVTQFAGTITDTSEDGHFYRYTNVLDTNEFFLIESRQKVGRSASIPGDGLTIWHVDRNGDNQTTHHEVYLVHAGNNVNTHTTACFRQGYRAEYSASTTPKSDFYTGPSGLRVYRIGPRGPVMTYKLGGPAFRFEFTGLSGDNNMNGFPEAGESMNLNISTLNIGQSASDPLKVYANVTLGGSFATVGTDTVFGAALPLTQSFASSFPLTLSPSAMLGAKFTVRFTVSDGSVTSSYSRDFLVGIAYAMSMDTVNTCAGIFLDDGGLAPYTSDIELLKTFLPAQPGAKIKITFQEFALETDPNCGVDYLEIYDGPTPMYPYIGTFCGNTSPGTITATDTSGALTFYFRSSPETSANGWRATVTCLSATESAELQNSVTFSAYPNPAKEFLHIRSHSGKSGTMTLTDLRGRTLKTMEAGSQDFTVSLTNIPSGFYFLRYQSADAVAVQKIEVRR